MTRARALKQVIRARAAKTGERYTTARRHVLDGLGPRSEPVLRPTVPAPADVTATTATPPAASRGVPSDAKVREKTGHGFDYWFAVLDRFGGAAKGHTALARHLYADHSVPGWHSQGITVAYERARGVRAANQRCDGEYEVSVSKVVSGTVADVVRAITDKRVRARWMKGISGPLPEALASALDSPASKGVVVRADGLARYRYNWGGTTVQLYIMPKAGGKASLVVTNSKLADSAMVEQRRALWRSALTALAQRFSRP
jgi:hypothetical protein